MNQFLIIQVMRINSLIKIVKNMQKKIIEFMIKILNLIKRLLIIIKLALYALVLKNLVAKQ